MHTHFYEYMQEKAAGSEWKLLTLLTATGRDDGRVARREGGMLALSTAFVFFALFKKKNYYVLLACLPITLFLKYKGISKHSWKNGIKG